jgi:hypothetical protein
LRERSVRPIRWLARAAGKKELASQGDYSHPPAKPSPPLKLATYTGKYENE